MAQRYTAIRGLQIKDATILPEKLDAVNSPADGLFLSYNSTQGKFEWKDPDVVGVSEDDVICNEVPSGAIDGSNTDFTLANNPAPGTVEVYLNGILQAPGTGKDYTISGNTISFTIAPEPGDVILCSYIKTP